MLYIALIKQRLHLRIIVESTHNYSDQRSIV